MRVQISRPALSNSPAGFARLAEAERAAALAAELPSLDAEIGTVTAQIDRRAAVSEDTRRLHGSRELPESLMLDELEIIEPRLRRMYACCRERQ